MNTSDLRILASARVYDRQVGGNTRYVREVYGRLPQHNVDVTWLRPPIEPHNKRLRSVLYAAGETILWPVSARMRGAEVLHFPADTGAVVRPTIPSVATIHGLATLHVPNVRSGRADQLWKARVRHLAKVSDRVITVSQSSADDIAYFEPSVASRVEVIHHGIDQSLFNRTHVADIRAIKAKFAIAGDFFLYAGNLDPRKNLVELAHAARTAFDATGVELVVSGSPAWDSEPILEALRTTRGVRYIGRTSDKEMITLMQHTVAFCFPSTYEGFGFPVLEAMACGAAVVCSDRGSLREVAGESALVLTDLSAPSIADAMISVARDDQLQSDLSRRGLLNASRFTWEKSAAEHARIFREVRG